MSDQSDLAGRDRLVDAVYGMLTELDNGDVWDNDKLPQFLDAFAALLGSAENTYTNTGRPVPDDPWELMIVALRGARYYD
jgi:hypothetical protein